MADNTGFRDDRGAVLVHVAFALLALMAFASFTFDYGVFWVSRRQAQNAADAGALAGAVALALDDKTDFSTTGPAKQSALAAAQANMVWGQAPNIVPATDIQHCLGPVALRTAPAAEHQTARAFAWMSTATRPVAMRCRCSSVASSD